MAQGQIVFQGVPNAASEFFSLAGIPHLPGKDIAEHMLEAAKSPFLVQTLAEFNKDRNRQVIPQSLLIWVRLNLRQCKQKTGISYPKP